MNSQITRAGIPLDKIPQKSRSLTSIGNETADAVSALYDEELFAMEGNGVDMDPLTEAFKQRHWSDTEAALVIRALIPSFKQHREIPVASLARWIQLHPDDSKQVIECFTTLPPPEIEIIRVLSRAGNQKVVFLANSRIAQTEVVLKKLLGSRDASERIFSRELRAYPLNMVHPNIIDTYPLKNALGELFLVEKRLSEVLNDDWRSKGIHDAANLLFDIGNALAFLHAKNLIHGDVKPDNLGKRGDAYVLLDFGLCRERDAFTPEVTPTGSLRTRAPELLAGLPSDTPEKIDVWALGATVYNAIQERFPLIEKEENVPRISSPEQRSFFEAKLRTRVENEWEKYLDFENIPKSVASILKKMLDKNPHTRATAKQVVDYVQQELAAFVCEDSVKGAATGKFTLADELDQLKQYLKETPKFLLPQAKLRTIRSRLEAIERAHGFGVDDKETIKHLISLVA